ncbi:hypothetical protein niasHT_018574 [Heterodera trifolii]|uniref:Uncharacterized protein n=1 Tax=Heterodera trifolii TaxID=157864 RepID=A0ABD2LBM0_9BILA
MLLPPMIFLALSLAFLLNNNGTFGGGCTSKDGVMVSNGQLKQEQLKKKRQGTTPKARDLSRRNSSTSIGSEIDMNDAIKFIKETTRDGYTSPMRSARFSADSPIPFPPPSPNVTHFADDKSSRIFSPTKNGIGSPMRNARFSADSQKPFPPLSPKITHFAGDKMERASSIAKNGIASPMRNARFSDSQMPFPPPSPTDFAGDKSSRAFSIAKNGIASPLRPPTSPKFTHFAGDKANRISSLANKSTEVKRESDFGKISEKITVRQKNGQKYTTAAAAAAHPRLDQNGMSTEAEPKTTEQLHSERLHWDPESTDKQTKLSCDEQFVDKKMDLPMKKIYKN